jgi:hypothetical protein
VARFIHQNQWGSELAGPFTQIAAAFESLESGGKPTLFSKKTSPPRERERSPERKHIHMMAVALEVLVRLDDPVATAAARVARHVNGWPGMSAQEVKGFTVVTWRKQNRRRKDFESIAQRVMEASNPREAIELLIQNGPGGHWQG